MKQAKDFAQKTGGETFKLEKAVSAEERAAQEQEKIVLNIGLSKDKIKLRFAPGQETTGNFFIDAYNKINGFIISMNKVKMQEKAVFFRLLAVMVEAGIPIIRSLHTLADQNKKNPKFEKIITEMAYKVEGGESLSGSMDLYKDVFSEAEIGMIRSGEVSGHLNDILRDLAKNTEKNARTLKKVKGALTYPIVVLVILFGVLVVMMTMVVPNITNMFVQSGAKLPEITQFVINMSSFMRNNLALMLGIIVVLGVCFVLWKRTKTGKFYWDIFKLHVPIIGPLIQKSVLAQFSQNLGNLLGAGVSIIQSMTIISNATSNEVYKRKIKFAGDDIRTGIPLAESLRNSKYFPTMLVNMVEIGEQTAQLETVTKKIADFYDEEVDLAVQGLTKVIEPVIMVFVGVAVGGLVAAIMLPIMSLADVAGTM
ncbi:type II secretion system F family protein [Candidatus Peregrinibacteria bacterium]|nr:type II secretion system F family protein [Candidatus Peregrinibacteria bacterium]